MKPTIGTMPCSAPGCTAAGQTDRAFCIAHWTPLPPELRERIRDAWTVMRAPGASTAERIAAMDDHRAAVAYAAAGFTAAAPARGEAA